MIRLSAGIGAMVLFSVAAGAETCRELVFETQPYAVCEVTVGADLRLFLDAADGRPLGTFDRLRAALEDQGQTLGFSMNAGMYHPDRRPVGFYVENGREISKLVRSAGPGNFGLVPNGVFCIRDNGFIVQETLAFDAARSDCKFATQSGPLLLMAGALHPRFIAGSDSRYIRNGVGVAADGGTVWFAISNRPVSFHEFARLFRDGLGAADALYFDGNISRLYAPEIGRDDFGFPMGPMVGLVLPTD